MFNTLSFPNLKSASFIFYFLFLIYIFVVVVIAQICLEMSSITVIFKRLSIFSWLGFPEGWRWTWKNSCVMDKILSGMRIAPICILILLFITYQKRKFSRGKDKIFQLFKTCESDFCSSVWLSWTYLFIAGNPMCRGTSFAMEITDHMVDSWSHMHSLLGSKIAAEQLVTLLHLYIPKGIYV